MTDVLERLRANDPAAHHDPEPPDALLRALVAEPRRARRRTRRPLLAAGAALAAAAAAAVVVLTGGGPSLAARAYAQTAPQDGVLHSVETMQETVGTIDETIKTEQWQRGDLVHRVLTVTEHGKPQIYDQVLGADGVLRNRLPEGTVQETRPGGGGESGDIIGQERNDPISRFRSAYAAGALNDAGAATFDGRPAHAYTRTTSERPKPLKLPNRTIDVGVQTMTDTFYLDPQTGAPLGYAHHITNNTTDAEFTIAIGTYERLDPTPENLAKLSW